MKKITLWLAAMALGLCLGCTPEPTVKIDRKFKLGQTVNMKIGGNEGHITWVWSTPSELPYQVRVWIDGRPEYLWFREFELEIEPNPEFIQWSEGEEWK